MLPELVEEPVPEELEPARPIPELPVAASFERCAAAPPAILDRLEADLGRALAFDDGDLQDAPEATKLDRGFLLPAVAALRTHPHAASCVIDAALPQRASVAAWLEAQAGFAARTPDVGQPPVGQALTPGAEVALEAICRAADGPCGAPEGTLDADFERALTPVLFALADTIAARRARDASASRGADWWSAHGGSALFDDDPERPHPAHAPDRLYLAADRKPLYGAAIALAEAIEGVDWSRFVGRDLVFEVATPAGAIRIRGATDDRHDDEGPALLFVDLGGDDHYATPIATNVDGRHPVSVAIDLAGNDLYEADGQGAAKNGVAMLFDLGGGDDRYVAEKTSQGYAHQGVGVLFDDGGDDTYVAEVASQGAAQYGLALLYDAGAGRDTYASRVYSQGFGFVAGVGALFDDGGDDTYHCDPDVVVSHPAPQTFGAHNASFCQGAGFGFRHADAQLALAGGVGMLVDRAGDDRYEAGVYAQGVGYWQGLGVQVDGAGDDEYRAVWYAAGVGVHYGAGVHVDAGQGADRRTYLEHAALGVGHDFGVGIAIEEGGDDVYELPSLSGGAASCGSVALFYDQRGDDVFVSASALSLGVAVVPEGCPAGAAHATVAVMIDGDGADSYVGAGAEGTMWSDEDPAEPSAVAVGIDTDAASMLPMVSF